jgi:hypothetical protein
MSAALAGSRGLRAVVPANPVSLTCLAKRAIVLELIRMHISSVERMKRASIPSWMVLRQLWQRDITAQAAARLGTLPPPCPTDKLATPGSIFGRPRARAPYRAVVRLLWKGAQVLLPASLIGVFFSRRRSADTLAALIGTASALALCVVLLQERGRYAPSQNDTSDTRPGLGAELQSMEAAMVRMADELGDTRPRPSASSLN